MKNGTTTSSRNAAISPYSSDIARILLGNIHGRANAPHPLGLLRPRRERPRRCRAAEQRNELAPFPLTEMHPIPQGPDRTGRIADWSGSVSGMLQTFAARRPSQDLRQIRAHQVAAIIQAAVALRAVGVEHFPPFHHVAVPPIFLDQLVEPNLFSMSPKTR
jgi:hypothetical protein